MLIAREGDTHTGKSETESSAVAATPLPMMLDEPGRACDQKLIHVDLRDYHATLTARLPIHFDGTRTKEKDN